MNLRKLLLGCCSILLINQASSQQLTFTRQQMREDADSFIHIIQRVSPHIPVKKVAWQYDAITFMKKAAKRIDTVTTDLSFYLVLQELLNLAQDQHTSTWFPQSEWMQTQSNHYNKTRNTFKMAIPNTYIDGQYIIREAFVALNDTIPIGSVITHINGQPVDAYVKARVGGRNYSYDAKHQKFYSGGFFKDLWSIFSDSLTLTFAPPNQVAKSYKLPTREFTKYLPVKFKYGDKTKVEFWEPENILYIRLKEMNSDSVPFLEREIAKYKHRVNEISRIIVDFRENGGGSDTTWQTLYANIIPSSIQYDLKISSTQASSTKKETNKMLAQLGLYNLIDKPQVIEPVANSLRFNGPIIVLFENHYSSAGSAMAIPNASKTDNIHAIGRKTGEFLGVGFSPVLYTLPHSKMLFRVAPSIETTHPTTPVALMHDELEQQVPYSIEHFKLISAYEGALFDREFLLKHDLFIKMALTYK
ncbi:peptidase S41-like protein [Chitinophaga skermanii]|uniref:Peptidase S41-like protein n=1 Tax=Chitinophaga skermanii TaxID=331697 RepID=A0A327QVQ3_9BACT|nr:S41 family peptidase [Chitinophaga skermanii]RAJ08460.1 peptidase S41-like protein [Chitinophaga skermanii]